MIEVSIATAMICFAGQCYPILASKLTPVGEFTLAHRSTGQYGYGGDVLVFKEVGEYLYAIHRTWPGRERHYANASVYRRTQTLGCINVQPETYEKLLACCKDQKLLVKVN